MRIVKRVLAVATSIIIMLSLVSCHKQNETAISYDDYKISSGLYLAMLIQADGEGREKLGTQFSEAGLETSSISYYKEKLEDKDFTTWVRDRALELCREYIVTLKLFDENKLTLDESQSIMASQYASYYWSSYGYQTMYEPNGVSEATFIKYFETSQFKKGNLFTYYYGEGGPKAVPEEEVLTGLVDNYVVANTISIPVANENSEALSAEEISAIETKLNGYVSRISAGESFDKIKKEHDADTSSEGDTASADTSSEGPQDPTATVYGGANTSDASNYFDNIKKLEVGVASVVKYEDVYMLAIKKDITADPYYLKTYRSSVISVLRKDEFEKFISEEGNKLELNINQGEVKYLAPKKLEYPATNTNPAAY